MKLAVHCSKAFYVTIPALALVATAAEARHSWKKYEWFYDGTNPISAPVVDNTTGDWSERVDTAVQNWNQSSRIASIQMSGSNSNCDFVTTEIQVCNGDYGDNGWLGIASIAINGNEIIAGYTKLNDFYFAQDRYNTESWKQLVTCQEIGHTYGLAHQNENFLTDATTSCMEYTSWPEGNEHPDQHDYDQLETMYSSGGTSTGGGGNKGGGGGGGGGRGKPTVLPSVGNTPSSWGRPVDYLPNGKPFVYERNMGSYRVLTHVTWAIEFAPEPGDHHH